MIVSKLSSNDPMDDIIVVFQVNYSCNKLNFIIKCYKKN